MSIYNFDQLKTDALAFNARHHQSILENQDNAAAIQSNLNLIQFVQDNADPSAIDSLTEILAQAQTDNTSVLNIVSTLEVKHNSELAAAQVSLQASINALEAKHNTELAAEVNSRQAALTALEAKHDAEKAALDSALAAEAQSRIDADTANANSQAAHAADVQATFADVAEVLNNALANQ
jgi:hypothetical protein